MIWARWLTRARGSVGHVAHLIGDLDDPLAGFGTDLDALDAV